MRTALVKAIALPAVYTEPTLIVNGTCLFQHSRTRVIDLRTRERRGFCTLVHSFCKLHDSKRACLDSNVALQSISILVQQHNKICSKTVTIEYHVKSILMMHSPAICV